jgi:hypothetical protein
MDYETLSTLLADPAYTSLTATDAATALNAATVSVAEPYYLSYRSIAGVLQDVAKLEALAARLAATMPITHAILAQVGNPDGSDGGLDVRSAAVQTAIDGMVSGEAWGITLADAAALKALGISTISPAANAGLGTVTAENVTLARAATALAGTTPATDPQAELQANAAVYTDLTDAQVVTLWNADYPGIGTTIFGRAVDLHDVSWARQQISQ